MNPKTKAVEKEQNKDNLAKAMIKDISVSTKYCVEICNALRYKTTGYALKYLDEVLAFKRAVPFRRSTKDVSHKPGMSAGKYPQKATKEFIKLIKSVEANAQFKGLDTTNLKIVKILANRASIPTTGGRHRRATKRSHLEIEVKELKNSDKNKDKNNQNKKNKENLNKENSNSQSHSQSNSQKVHQKAKEHKTVGGDN